MMYYRLRPLTSSKLITFGPYVRTSSTAASMTEQIGRDCGQSLGCSPSGTLPLSFPLTIAHVRRSLPHLRFLGRKCAAISSVPPP